MEPEIIIGMPVYNDFKFFRLAVDSLIKSTNFPFRLLIIESYSTDGSLEYSDLLHKIYPQIPIEVIHTKKEGPLKAYNQLFDIALEREKDLILTQTDVIFPKLFMRDWLFEFNKISKMPKVGAVTTVNGGGISGPSYAEGFKWIGGWCSYIPYNTIKKIGKFDENFIIGDGVDIDYSYRIHREGWKIVFTSYWVDHHMMNARSLEGNYKHEDIEEIKKQNARYFKKKFREDFK